MQFSIWIYERFLKQHIDMERQMKEKRKLQVATNENLQKQIREESIDLIRKLVLCVVVIWILGILVLLQAVLQEDGKIHLPRDDYDGEVTTYELQTDASLEESVVMVEVQPRQYTDEEIEVLFEEGFAYVEKHLIGENKDYEHVCKPLNLMNSIPDSPLKVELFWENDRVLDEEGNVIYEAFEGTESLCVQVLLSYGEDCRERSIQMILCQPGHSKLELAVMAMEEELRRIEQNSLCEEEIRIPKEMNGVTLSYEEESTTMGWIICVLVVPVLVYYQHKQKTKDALAAREEELIAMYPGIVNQMVLYLGAGMNIKGCFVQFAKDYQLRKKEIGKVEYFYEECSAMVQELRNGGSEQYCYEMLGKQLDLPVYRRLMTMLSQNLTKGSKGILDLLQQEMEQALQYQKEYAQKRGEEAGTKLLFPMLLLLVVVMVIIMIPGFLSFSL